MTIENTATRVTVGPFSEPSLAERARAQEIWEYRTAALRDAARIAQLEADLDRFYEKVNDERTGNTVWDLLRIAEGHIARLEAEIRDLASDERVRQAWDVTPPGWGGRC